MESGYASSYHHASKDAAPGSVPSDNSDDHTVNDICHIEGNTGHTESRVEAEQKGVGSSGSHECLTDTASLSIRMQNEDASEESGDVELGGFFLEDDTASHALTPEVLELQKREKMIELCSEKNLDKLEGIWKKVISTLHEANHCANAASGNLRM